MDKAPRWSLSGFLIVAIALLPASKAMAEESVGRVEVGQEAPLFELETLDGVHLKAVDLRGESPLVLIFFRGTW